MPTLAMMYDDMVRKPMQKVLDEVKLEGLIKLISQGCSTGHHFITPDIDKYTQLDWAKKIELEINEWDKTHKGPNPNFYYISRVWMPQKLITKERLDATIIQAYAPLRFILPLSEKETYKELKERIEKESLRAVEYTRKESMGKVNAFYVGNLGKDYIIPDLEDGCSLISGDSFLNRIAKDILVPRIVFNLSLFEIKEK